jgi:hypothetical protein
MIYFNASLSSFIHIPFLHGTLSSMHAVMTKQIAKVNNNRRIEAIPIEEHNSTVPGVMEKRKLLLPPFFSGSTKREKGREREVGWSHGSTLCIRGLILA